MVIHNTLGCFVWSLARYGVIRHDPTLCFGANALVTRPIAHIQSPRHKCDYQAINHWKDTERAIVSEPHTVFVSSVM